MSTVPSIFIGHGSPMNAIEHNELSDTWREIAATIPTPKAILCISAHWLTENIAVTAMEYPKTIHDFYGFPPELYQQHYTAKGSPEYAALIKETITSIPLELDTEWGLDHGTWSVLMHMYPEANIPVLQLSINYDLPFATHYKLGQELRRLRDKGILIIGSGNIVHNLSTLNFETPTAAYSWSNAFDEYIGSVIANGNHAAVINAQEHPDFKKAQPTYDHFIPLVYILGTSHKDEPVKFYNESIVLGSLSMRCVVFGQ